MSRKIINVYEKQPDPLKEKIVFSGAREACRNFIGHQAFELNHGNYYSWQMPSETEQLYFFDCGPITYYTKENIYLVMKRNSK